MHSPVSSRSSFSSYDSSRPDHGTWQRPMPIKQTRRRREPGELFAILPSEVLQLILTELRKIHLRPNSESCATCMMRDLCSVAQTCRRLSKAAQNTLYEDIQIIGADSAAHKKRFKGTTGTRLTLLRRTLRANPELAGLVRTLKVPATPVDAVAEKYQDKVASVIMACPNFERLLGFHQPYDHSFSRLFHALSTRENLKEMNWFLEAAPAVQSKNRSKAQPAPGAGDSHGADLDMERSTTFFDLHMNWARLTTLSIHCGPDAALDGISMFGMTLANMPALQNLYLSNLPVTVFNDATLLSLPPLQTLSLSNLQGVTSAGLAAFARRPSSHSIRRLTLRHLGIDSLPALGRLFSYLTALESFTFVQFEAPEMPADEVIWLYPYLASNSLQKLHWDVPTYSGGASEADRILAKSIASQGYPALRALRTPHDPDAVFQGLCSPLERIDMASDKYRGLIARIPDRVKAPEPSPPVTPISPTSPRGFGKPFSNMKLTNDPPTPVEAPASESSHLAQSRLAAQGRIEAAKNVPRFQVNVIDEDGTVLEKFGLAGFIGQVESKTQYVVKPDPGATDENGGLTVITDLLRDGGEELKDREGCTGRWLSWAEGMTADKKERERWWHTERGRWQELQMS
ncbi:uncharacterized protein B0I36DRAFT_248907 [Microdochium trichocladiopsis]|uniref:F-box domain-containing protein n=1 Tax=Microdochium trichocladiopsis TaxID=1682393 RepID=A0A9P8Y044_9PEZI|nr:uncharacterized protein B0I36DRAFT_248907 [Microdochium trichocladiopsis]KAH7026327.1 hypothetical protein B0I36DRAFT_248907 [Microdochium trichocladiopsis]